MRLRFAMKQFAAVGMILLMGCSGSDLKKGTVALELGDYTLAIGFFSRILERNPANSDARLGMGKALLQQAIDNPGDTVSWRSAVMQFEAVRTIGDFPDIGPLLSQVWSERAYELLHRSDTLGALEALTRAIAADAQSPEPLNLAGIIYFRTGKSAKARLLFNRAIVADTLNPSPLFNLGMLCWEEGGVRDAHDLWLRALKLSPQDEDFLYWFAVAEKRLRETPSGNAAPDRGDH
jgi:Flp pilus assembly protein TadD